MTMLMFLIVISCCLSGVYSPSSSVSAVRLRDNSNVLVPNNDVNLKAKIKKAFNGDVDLVDFQEIKINDIKVKNPKIEKLIVGQLERNKNFEYEENDKMNLSEMSNFTSFEYVKTTESNFPTESSTPTQMSTFENFNTTSSPSNNNEKSKNECILASDSIDIKPKWIFDNGTLNLDIIRAEDGSVEIADLSRKFKSFLEYENFIDKKENEKNYQRIKYLSMAFNNLNQMPRKLISLSNETLHALSLIGNDFRCQTQTCLGFVKLPLLKFLDMRNCKLKSLKAGIFDDLINLEYLDVSNNEIIQILANAFPRSIKHIDLSYNINPASVVQEGIKIQPPELLNNLKFLNSVDFSYTKIEAKSVVAALRQLPESLKFISLCWVELPDFKGKLFENNSKIEMLDLSGNPRLVLGPEKFETIQDSLQVLHVRNSNVRNLEWTKGLKKLKSIDLFDNNIHTITPESFSHMEELVKLDLERNSIGNWYDKMFSNNQKLDILNLRENKLNKLTNDMKDDFQNVKFLALGKNEFDCNCEVQEFFHKLFRDTKSANVTALKRFSPMIEYDDENTEIEDENKFTKVAMAARIASPQYDVILRTFKKYYEMAEQSINALKLRLSKSELMNNNLVMRNSRKYENNIDDENNDYSPTLLFDYDEDDDDYECINLNSKDKKPIIELSLCKEEKMSGNDPTTLDSLTILYVSLPSVIIFCILCTILYSKWFYVKYFFVLCKNTAILTFIEDSSDKDSIISKRRSCTSIDEFIYDVFVSYSEQNRSWILNEFIPNIEKRESINVCLHERDFTVGLGILENIISCMDQSRCLLMLISEDFIQSQWCQFEMNLAQHRLLETRREKLILVLLEDIPLRKQPRTLKYLMRTKTYIKWPQNGGIDEKILFWRRLKKALISTKWEVENYGSVV